MPQVKVINGDLYIIFQESKDDVFVTYRLDNGAEFNFLNDELAQIILPNFERQLNRGALSEVHMELLNTRFDDTRLVLPLKIINDVINISLDCSSIMQKV